MRKLLLVGVAVLLSLAGCCSRPPAHAVAQGSVVPRPDRELITVEFREESIGEVMEYIARRVGRTIVLDAGIEDKITVNFQRLPWLQAVEEAADRARCVVRQSGDRTLVEKPPRVTMEFRRVELTEVIHLLAKQAGKSIVMDPGLKGEVTMRFSDVPWMRALNAAVKTSGYILIEEDRGTILRVADPGNLIPQMETWILYFRHIRPSEFWKAKITSSTGPGVSPKNGDAPRIFTLLDTLRNMLSRQPGSAGKVPLGTLDYDEAANAILVTDIKPVIEMMRRIIEQWDVPPTK